MTYKEKSVRATIRPLNSFLRTLFGHGEGVAPTSIGPWFDLLMRIEVLARASHPEDLLALYGVPRGSSSASRREECHQLGRYWPLTTRSPAARAPRFKFVILTVSSAPPGAWPLLLSYLLPCSSAPYSSSRSL